MINDEHEHEVECTYCKQTYRNEEAITKHYIEEHNHRKDRYE